MAYNTLSPEDIVLSSEAVTTPMWSSGTESLVAGESDNGFYTSSIQTMGLSGDYYIDIYGKNPQQVTGSLAVEFACTFGCKYGSGSSPYDAEVPENTPSRTMFGQYRSLVLGDEESDFYFGSGSSQVSSSYFWVINVDRARYKESLMPGTFVLTMSGSAGDLVLVDNSAVQGSTKYIDSGRVFSIVEGKLNSNGSGYSPDPSKLNISYGYFLPDIGVILLDGKSLVDKGATAGNPISSTNMLNSIMYFVNKIKKFTLQAKETVTSNYIFVRAKNSEFNYSMNPSNITSTGELRHKVMANSPETYITTIGLYNDNNDLVAVAKLSRPLPKNFTKEALFRIKLDY